MEQKKATRRRFFLDTIQKAEYVDSYYTIVKDLMAQCAEGQGAGKQAGEQPPEYPYTVSFPARHHTQENPDPVEKP